MVKKKKSNYGENPTIRQQGSSCVSSFKGSPKRDHLSFVWVFRDESLQDNARTYKKKSDRKGMKLFLNTRQHFLLFREANIDLSCLELFNKIFY